MYSPSHYITHDQQKISEIISENPLVTLVIDGDAVHLPLIKSDEKLIGHMALKNPLWKKLDGKEILAVFHGPQGYISASWYESEELLPTWNYVVVHVRGSVKIDRSEAFIKKALLLLGHHTDPQYNLEKAINQHTNLLKQIVGFEISIHSIEAKEKLAQQKSVEVRKNVIRHFRAKSPIKNLADAMERTL